MLELCELYAIISELLLVAAEANARHALSSSTGFKNQDNNSLSVSKSMFKLLARSIMLFISIL